jgi:hypothetical protein
VSDTENKPAYWGDLDKESVQGWGCLIFLCVIGYGIYGAYEGLDSIGWISHKAEASITAESSWMEGESKTCISTPFNSEAAKSFNKPVGYAMAFLNCDDGPSHNISITFWGREIQQGNKAVFWSCTRTQDSFNCKQTGAD